ncbi:hypothetical protein EV142_102103 [Flavobacterium circumlabens]|uniref:AraC family transcriptional regulator n=1 Tax=Flavobacterium circumlabens TaxID=2133765 RepID=A0ABY2B339_9FLAO|nr:hypothetical protein EV142_102103 [Flavobacterium circumlabens]
MAVNFIKLAPYVIRNFQHVESLIPNVEFKAYADNVHYSVSNVFPISNVYTIVFDR